MGMVLFQLIKAKTDFFWTYERLLNNFSVLLQSILSASNLHPIFNLIAAFLYVFQIWEAALKALNDEEAIKQKLCEDLNNLVYFFAIGG